MIEKIALEEAAVETETTHENMENDMESLKDEDNNSDSFLIPDQLPSFLADAFADVYREDGLVVLGRGLGILSLISALIRFYGDVEKGHLAVVAEDQEEEFKKKMQDQSQPGSKYLDAAFMGSSIQQNDENQQSAVPLTQNLTQRPPLVFVLGLRDVERKAVVSILEKWGTPPDLLPQMVTNESGQGKERQLLYKRGGIFIITSRILIVDLLTHVANPADIEGILVAHAESVSEQSTEAFILRIFRTQRHWCQSNSSQVLEGPSVTKGAGFIKAFTDDPASLMAGFHKVDKILKALNVRRLYLYPRFHDTIREELESHPPEVIELHQALTPLMSEVQHAIAAAIDTCITELKQSTPLIEWNDADVSLENCLSKNFDLAISRQLDQDWHRLRPHSKQLVADLRTLRTLLKYLIEYDSVSFWKLLQNIKSMSAASKYPSMWILTKAGDLLFRKAKERVYSLQVVKPSKGSTGTKPYTRLVPVLEENPKWRLLRKVLTEVKQEWDSSRKQECDWRIGPRVLIMCRDERTVETLRSYLVHGRERTMTLRWLKYLEGFNENARAVTKGQQGVSGLSDEARLLLEEESRARHVLYGHDNRPKDDAASSYGNEDVTLDSSIMRKSKRSCKTFKCKTSESTPSPRKRKLVSDWQQKRRKVATEMHRGGQLNEDEVQQRELLDEVVDAAEKDLDKVVIEHGTSLFGNQDDEEEDDDELLHVSSMDDELTIMFRTFADAEGENASFMLSDLCPSTIVLYDADPSFIRSIEIHSATTLNNYDSQIKSKLKVYFTLFESSAEEKAFLKNLEREQTAFERLIHHVRTMPLPVNTMTGMTQELQQTMIQSQAAGAGGGTYANGTLPLSVDTRTGRGAMSVKQNKIRRDIAVDVREFRSALPSVLHQGGMRLAPVTLTVGDYVLSPVHCIERKSISDLFGSFTSGRLFTQVEQMAKHYKCPCLLIEFDPSKSFCLQSVNELGSDIRTDSVCSKICLLTMHFPALRLLWSREQHETLKLFKILKQNHEEVNVEKAVEIGSNESIDNMLGGPDCDSDEINETARDLLLRLPGINVNNARKVMSVCDTLADLADLSRDDLRELLGPISGQKLFTFLHQRISS